MSRKLLLVSALFFAASGSGVFAAEEQRTLRSNYDNGPDFGGPGAINVQLQEEDELKVPVFEFENFDEWLQPWFDTKARLNEDLGTQIGVDYNYMMQGANESLNGDDLASSGIFRLYGKWDVFNKDSVDKGSFFAKVEHRHRIGDKIGRAHV